MSILKFLEQFGSKNRNFVGVRVFCRCSLCLLCSYRTVLIKIDRLSVAMKGNNVQRRTSIFSQLYETYFYIFLKRTNKKCHRGNIYLSNNSYCIGAV